MTIASKISFKNNQRRKRRRCGRVTYLRYLLFSRLLALSSRFAMIYTGIPSRVMLCLTHSCQGCTSDLTAVSQSRGSEGGRIATWLASSTATPTWWPLQAGHINAGIPVSGRPRFKSTLETFTTCGQSPTHVRQEPLPCRAYFIICENRGAIKSWQSWNVASWYFLGVTRRCLMCAHKLIAGRKFIQIQRLAEPLTDFRVIGFRILSAVVSACQS